MHDTFSKEQREADRILNLPMSQNDAGARTIREYFVKMAQMVWSEGESFNGKRPFGNSGWEWEVYDALIRAGEIPGTLATDEAEIDCDARQADAVITKALKGL